MISTTLTPASFGSFLNQKVLPTRRLSLFAERKTNFTNVTCDHIAGTTKNDSTKARPPSLSVNSNQTSLARSA
jgi:hypothetical protein